MSTGRIVATQSGKVEGRDEEGVQVFRGIPFAAPPVGPLRFAAPQPVTPWKGVRAAVEFGPSAPQNPMLLPLPGMDVGAQDEDCLYLNVYTPNSDDAARPVMVWIHGGGFVIGSASQSLYDGAPLAKRGDVVVVTINYRLGPLGFLYLPELCPDLEGAVGNAGIRDMVAALEWVRDNIAAFGGDPGQVTIFGESAGGMSVGTLLGMPAARGLFARAIPQSGAAHNAHTRETATKVAEHFLEALGMAPGSAATTLRAIPPDKLLDTQQQTMLKLGSRLGLLPFQPLVDGDSLPQTPLDAVVAGSAAGVSLMTGSTREEWRLFGILDPSLAKLDEAAVAKRIRPQLGGKDPAVFLDAYRDAIQGFGASEPKDVYCAIETDRVFRIPAIRLADAQRAHGDVYLYRFDWQSPAFGGALGACHAVELPFVFGVLHKEGAELFAGTGPEADALAEIVMDAWLAFARNGDPSHSGLRGGTWPEYDGERRPTMLLSQVCEVEHDPAGRQRALWEDIL